MVMESQDSEELPSDVLELSRIVAGLLAKNRILIEEKESLLTKQDALLDEKAVLTRETILLANKVNSLADEIKPLKEQLALLKAKRFSKSSEKLNKQISELELRIEDKEVEEAQKGRVASDKLTKGKSRTGRIKLPEHLERIDNIIAEPLVCDECGGKEFRKINDDISETLEYIPSSFKVIRHIRPRCVIHTDCFNFGGVLQ